MQDDWTGFERKVLHVLQNPAGTAGSVFLLSFLQKKGLLWRWIEDVERLPLDVSVKIAEFALLFDRDFDMRLADRLDQRATDGAVRLRLVELIERTSRGNRAIERIKNLADDPDKRVRSKVVRLLGRISEEAAEARRKLNDPDPRVRAAAVEALWGHAAEHGRPVFLSALKDPNHRVRGNAIAGLYQLDDTACLPALRALLDDADEIVRRAGVWAIEHTRDVRYLSLVAKMLASATPEGRSRCLRAMHAARARKAEAAAAGHFDIQVGLLSRGADGWVTVPVRCEKDGQAVEGIAALDFAILEDSRALDSYHVEAVAPSPLLALEYPPAGTLYASFHDGLDSATPPGRVLILTSGAHEEDWPGIAGLAGRLVAERVKVDAVVAGAGPSQQRLKVLAEIAGGRFWGLSTLDEAKAVSAQLRGSYEANYQIRYQGPGGVLKVEVFGAKGVGEMVGAQGLEPRTSCV